MRFRVDLLLRRLFCVVAALLSADNVAYAVSVPCSPGALVSAVQTAVTAGGQQTLDLTTACTYTLTAVYTGAGTLNATGLPFINNGTTPVALTINGHGATITRDAGAPQFRFFLVFGSNSLSLNQVTLSGGRAPDGTGVGGGVGGAIVNYGSVSLQSVSVSNNRGGQGPAGFTGGSGGAIYNDVNASMTIADSAFSNNTAGSGSPGGFGGAIQNFGTLDITGSQFLANVAGDGAAGSGSAGLKGGGGGAIQNSGSLTIASSSIGNNIAGNGGVGSPNNGVGGDGGGIHNSGRLTISYTTVSSNTAGNGGGGGTGGAGGGLHTEGTGSVTVTTSTFSGNVTGSGGNGGGMHLFAAATIANTTITGNTAGNEGGAIYAAASPVNVTNATLMGNSADGGDGGAICTGAMSLRNTIVAGNTPGNCCPGPGLITDAGHNLDSGTTCGFDSANASKSNANANLGTLANNGGPTYTNALLAPSDAIDAGDDAACATAPVNGIDQRGVARPQGAHCDIGAYEASAAPATATASPSGTLAPSPTPTASPGLCAGPSNGRVSCWKGEGNASDSVDGNNGVLEGGHHI